MTLGEIVEAEGGSSGLEDVAVELARAVAMYEVELSQAGMPQETTKGLVLQFAGRLLGAWEVTGMSEELADRLGQALCNGWIKRVNEPAKEGQ